MRTSFSSHALKACCITILLAGIQMLVGCGQGDTSRSDTSQGDTESPIVGTESAKAETPKKIETAESDGVTLQDSLADSETAIDAETAVDEDFSLEFSEDPSGTFEDELSIDDLGNENEVMEENDLTNYSVSEAIDYFSEKLVGSAAGVESAPITVGMMGLNGRTVHYCPNLAGMHDWLAAHQFPDGSWSFNHAIHPKCAGKCSNSVTVDRRRYAATGLVLLALMGTDRKLTAGVYYDRINSGVAYLIKEMGPESEGCRTWSNDQNDLWSHAIATYALCETCRYGRHFEVKVDAQKALNYILRMQAPDGGWRESGDAESNILLTALQVMVLRAGCLAGLNVPSITMENVTAFVDKVQLDDGKTYGYSVSNHDPTATPAGLLCRIYLQWSTDDPRIKQGIIEYMKNGKPKNLFTMFLASEVMHYMDPEYTDPDISEFRRMPIDDNQSLERFTLGSIYFPNYKTDREEMKGRIFHTAISALVYQSKYRNRWSAESKSW